MKPVDVLPYLPHFPEGSEPVILGAPPGLESIVKEAPCILMADGSYCFVLEFDDHEEWKEFKKNRQLLMIVMSTPAPFAIGAFHVGPTEGQENSLLELQSEDIRKTN